MAAGDTTQGITVKVDGVAVGQVMDATLTSSVVTVDCTCLDDTYTDMRAGTFNPSGSITISLKDSGSHTYKAGDVITFEVGSLGTFTVRIESVEEGGSANSPNTVRLNVVSTTEGT